MDRSALVQSPARPYQGVAVRMYRLPSLGNCFLLKLPSKTPEPFHVLIDCGVMVNVPSEAIMRSIMQDICDTTHGHLDLVVVSDIRWDHVSGFLQAGAILQDMEVERVWAHLVDQRLDLGIQTPQYINALLTMLANVIKKKSAISPRSEDKQPRERESLKLMRNSRSAVRRIIQVGKRVECRGSGDFIDLGSIRFYILGPYFPAQPSGYIRMIQGLMCGMRLADRTKLEDEQALNYALQILALGGAPGWLPEEDRKQIERSRPFEQKEGIPLAEASTSKYAQFFRDMYGDEKAPGKGPAWRRIEPDWVKPAEDLVERVCALRKVCMHAMAIELVPSGKVLLFPGDAREDEWKEWQRLHWTVGPEGRKVSFCDLLARTVVYKVSHYGSWIGNPLKGGMDGLVSPELIALLPVDQVQASKKRWQLPHAEVLDCLLQRANGRVLRMDKLPFEKPAGMASADWEAFSSRLTYGPGDSWVELKVFDEEGNA